MVGVVVFAVGLALATWRSYTLDRKRVRADAASSAERTAGGAQVFVDRELASLRGIASLPAFEASDVAAVEDILSPSAMKAIGPRSLTWTRTDGHVAAAGGLSAAQLAVLRKADLSTRPAIQAILHRGATGYVSPAVRSVVDGSPLIVFSVPTFDQGGARNGVLGAVIALDQPTFGTLFSRSQVVLDSSDQVVWNGGPVHSLRRAAPDVARATRAHTSGSITDATGASGRSGRLIGYATVPSSRWVVTQERSWSGAISPARQRLFLEWLGIALAMVAALGGTYIGLRRTREAQALLVERAARDALLAETTAAIASAATFEEAARALVENTALALHADEGVVVRVTDNGAQLRPIAQVGYPPDRPPMPTATADRVVLAECVREGRPVTFSTRESFERDYDSAQRMPEVQSGIGVPLVSGGRALAAVGLMFHRELVLQPGDVEFVEALATHAAAVLDRMRQTELVHERDAQVALAASASRVGAWTYDPETAAVWWSPATFGLFAIPSTDCDFASRWLARVPDDDIAAMQRMFDECAREGHAQFSYRYRDDDTERTFRAFATRMSAGTIVGTVLDVTDEVMSEARSRARADAAARLAAAARVEDVADVALATLADQFGSEAAFVLLHDAATQRTTVIAADGWPERDPDEPLDLSGRPAGAVLADGTPRYYESPEEIDAAHPALAPRRRTDGIAALACVPLLAGGRMVGVLQMHWRRPTPMPAMLRDEIVSFASKVAQALDRAHLVDEHLTDATRSEQLAQLAADLAQITDIERIAETTSRACVAILGTQTASVVERGDDRHYHVHLAGHVGPKARRTWYELPVEFDSHPARVFRTGEWQTHTSPDAINAAFPTFPASEYLRLGVGAMVSAPLTEHGTVHGVVTLTWAEPHDPSPRERDWIATVASAVSQALLRSRLAQRAQTARERAEALARLAAAIAELRDPAELAVTIVDAVRGATGADRATVFALDDERTALVRVATGGTVFGTPIDEVPLASPLPVATAARTRAAVYLNREELAADHPILADRMPQMFASASLPLVAHGQLMGVLALAYAAERAFDADERAHLAAVTSHTALALERARLFHEQRDLAETLQRSMLPGVLATPPALAASGGYAPGTEGLLIGGDWYDVVARDDGSALVVVGDVAGHGREAAIIMGRLRTLVTAHARLSPGELLDVLHEQCLRDQTMATCAVLAVDPISGDALAANAGHLPLVVVPPEAPARLLDVPPSLPLGVGSASYPTHDVQFEPGTLLVAYTDGLVERRRDSLSDSLLRLVEACNALRGVDPEQASATLLGRLDAQQRSDDTVVLVVQLAARHAPLELTVPAAASSARAVRETLKRWLVHEGVPDVALGDVLVASGEAVANAIVHAYPAGRRGPIHVSARADAEAVFVTIADEGTWRAPRDQRGMGLTLIRSLVNGAVERSPDGTTVRIRYPVTRRASVA
jgi:GAF domain-containing protein/anti-sigma regulatory factor (Ser/Thr protein kinase)